jgi:nicotinamidase-related amidase
MNIQPEEPSDEKESPAKNFSRTPQEEMDQQEVSETIPKQKSSKKQDKEPQRYEELKIKDGPIYNWTKTKEYSSYDNDALSIADDSVLSEDDSNVSLSSPIYCRPSPLPAETTALLIVDVQPEYWSNCPAVRKDFPDFPKHLQKTIETCRQRRAKIIWVRANYNHKHSPWLNQFERIRGQRNLGEVSCDPSSPQFTWEEFATPEGGEVIIAKSSWSSTSNTALVDILKVACIETVLVCGLITSVCVQHSAFGIFEAGYRTLLVTDACADRGKARHEAALALYGDYMYELVTSEDLESRTTGLIPAEPVWLFLDEKTNMVRANSFPKHVIRPSSSTGTMSTASSNMSRSSASTSSFSNNNNHTNIRNEEEYEEKTTRRTISVGGNFKIAGSCMNND